MLRSFDFAALLERRLTPPYIPTIEDDRDRSFIEGEKLPLPVRAQPEEIKQPFVCIGCCSLSSNAEAEDWFTGTRPTHANRVGRQHACVFAAYLVQPKALGCRRHF